MAGLGLFSAMTLAHLPTLLLLIGYPVYWIELYFLPHPSGHTTYFAAALFMLAVVVVMARSIRQAGADQLWRWHVWGWSCAGISLFILGIMAWASLLPPHLIQESDVMNYHITLPRQHLMLNSFAHLPWSSADLFLLPIDFALAPYWLMTELPNKYPQFIFFAGLLLAAGSLTRRLGGDRDKTWMAGFFILGAHGIAIQGGTAMLDVVLCYLFIAALDSLLKGRAVLAAIELAFFVFAKPGIPMMFVAVVGAVVLLWFLARGQTTSWGFFPSGTGMPPVKFKVFALSFLCAALCVGGPFMVKAAMHTGTPFYPIGAGMLTSNTEPVSAMRQEIDRRGKDHFAAKDQYGGRGMKDLVTHFWLIAVPEKGVNNRFDYPLGLPWLLMLGPFAFFLFKACRGRNFPLLPVLCVVYWLFWWLTCQQSRFLFVPMALMIITVVAAIPRISRVLWACAITALLLTALSAYRAHAGDLGKRPYEVLRAYDRQLLSQAKLVKPGDVGEVDTPDAAFAPFIINVKKEHMFFVLTP